jgi:hypothetical protein
VQAIAQLVLMDILEIKVDHPFAFHVAPIPSVHLIIRIVIIIIASLKLKIQTLNTIFHNFKLNLEETYMV